MKVCSGELMSFPSLLSLCQEASSGAGLKTYWLLLVSRRAKKSDVSLSKI